MKKEKWMGLAMVAPSFLILLFIVILPVLQSVQLSFQDEKTGEYTLNNYIEIFTTPSSVENILYTLFIVVMTVVIAIAVAYPLALYTTFSTSRIAKWIANLYMMTRFIPGIVVIYAMMNVIRDTGVLHRFLLLFGINLDPSLMYTANGIILLNLWFNIPFAAMIIGSALAGVKESILESARDVGANYKERFQYIILPLSYKSALLAAVFVFMGNIGSFTTPFLIGSNAPRMLGVALHQEFSVFYNPNMASALAVVMFGLSSVAGAVYIYSMMKKDKWA